MRQIAGMAFAAVALMWAGCADTGGPADLTVADLRVSSGSDIRDTISAEPATRITIEALSGGNRPLTAVQLHAEVHPQDAAAGRLTIRSSAQSSYKTSLVASTDASGAVTLHVRLGTVAGPARIIVSAPGTMLTDTITVVVLPGAAAAAGVSPRDTVVIEGQSITFEGPTLDRAGNFRDDPMTLRVTGTPVVRNGAVPRLVTMSNVGTAFVHLAVTINNRTFADSARVVAVPRAQFAYVAGDSLLVGDLAGQNRTLWASASPAMPTWSWDGRRLAFVRNGQLWIADSPGNATQVATPGLRNIMWPEFDKLDRSIYVQAQGSGGTVSIHRVWLNSPTIDVVLTRDSRMPDLPWTGSYMLHTSAGSPSVQLYELELHQTRQYATGGAMEPGTPRWLPDGRIAYSQNATGGALRIIDPWHHTTRTAGGNFIAGLTWAPRDLVVGSNGTHLLLAHVPGSYITWQAPSDLKQTRGRHPAYRPGT